jgi:RNA polymerase sigma factor (sigma-70 family)
MPPMTHDRTRRTLDALWRMESPRLVARIARMTGDVAIAEELAQDVLVAALEHWPGDGVPDNPAAWLMAAAKRRAIDHLRQRALHADKQTEYGLELQLHGTDMAHDRADEHADDDIGDDLLRLVFAACHPVLPLESRVALTLRLLGGLTTAEIARAFLQPEPTVAQRIVRAKRMLAEKQVPFEVPRKADLAERLDAVLEAIYLIFNEGYAASSGEDWMRPALCEEALRLGRVLVGLLPGESETLGLLALMELQASRAKARVAADGSPVLLLEQDRARWDRLQIQRGLQALNRAQQLGGARGPYALQAAIAACHARVSRATDTDWARIAALYAVLAQVQPSPVVELNRAVAIGKAQGPAFALPLVDALCDAAQLRDYGLLYAVRGDLLEQLARRDEARDAFERAAALAANARDRSLMLARAARCSTTE